jgi:hypothetical protein
MTESHKEQFIGALAKSLEEGTFVKLSLSKYKGERHSPLFPL